LLQLLAHPLVPDDESDVGVRELYAPEAGSPRVMPINEPYIAQHLSPAMGDWGTLIRQTAATYFLSDRYADVWAPRLRELVLARLQAQARAAAGQYGLSDPLLVIKESNGSVGADFVMSLFPRSRLIFLLRDGRDVVDSILDAQAPGGWLGSSEASSATDTRERLAIVQRESWRWVARTEAVQRAYAKHAPALRIVVRYEEMRDNVSPVLAALDAWLGLQRDSDWHSSARRWNDFDSYPAEAKGPGMPLRAATPGLWRANLSADEQSLMLDTMRAKLTELGYDVT
jgi:sulfotransferase family protein